MTMQAILRRLVFGLDEDIEEVTDPQWSRLQTANDLLGTPYRRGLLQLLYEMSAIPRATFDTYVMAPIERYAAFVQLLPASESHHHSYPGGLLDHGLEIMCYALRIRRKHLLPAGARPEDQVSVGELWSMGILYAALLHDVSKAAVDVDILLQDGSLWCLWNGPIPRAYRVRYKSGRDYHLHAATGALFARDILGGAVLDWLYSDTALFGQVMYSISGHMERAGIVGEIVHQADKSSVSKAMGGDLRRLDAAPKQSLQRKLIDALRHLVKSEHLPLNGTKGSAVFLSEDAVWFVTPTVPRSLKTYLYEQGIPGVPADESRLYDEMLAHGLVLPNPEGLAVWSGCTVKVGEWSTSKLHLLKATPSLIWAAGDERPEAKAVVTPPDVEQSMDSSDPALETGASIGDTRNRLISDELGGNVIPAVDASLSLDPQPKHQQLHSQAEKICEVAHDQGDEFISWVREGIHSKKLGVNHAKAVVHVVAGSWFLVSPNIFKKYCVDRYGHDGAWEQVQIRFQKKKLHVRCPGPEKRNIVTVSVAGPSGKTSILKGVLLSKPDILGVPPANNIYLELREGN